MATCRVQTSLAHAHRIERRRLPDGNRRSVSELRRAGTERGIARWLARLAAVPARQVIVVTDGIQWRDDAKSGLVAECERHAIELTYRSYRLNWRGRSDGAIQPVQSSQPLGMRGTLHCGSGRTTPTAPARRVHVRGCADARSCPGARGAERRRPDLNVGSHRALEVPEACKPWGASLAPSSNAPSWRSPANFAP